MFVMDPPSRVLRTCQLNGASARGSTVSMLAPFASRLQRTDRIATHVVAVPHEYSQSGQFSEKTDSYAAGVIMLELITGLPAKHVVGMMYDDAGEITEQNSHLPDIQSDP